MDTCNINKLKVMKNIITLLIACFFVNNLFAQKIIIDHQIPKTALQVVVMVKKEVVVSGPYARYAQQYLGITAPLSGRTEYSIANATVGVIDGNSTKCNIVSNNEDVNFLDMGVDPTYAAEVSSGGNLRADKLRAKDKSLAEMAKDAANMIYKLRKKRLEVITGETQDSFGEGVKTAVSEMNRIEQMYIDLFVGKKIVSYSTHNFGLVPSSEITSYVICRFSPKEGVLDVLSANGESLALLLVPENTVKFVPQPTGRKNKNVVFDTNSYIVKDWVKASLMLKTEHITTSMLEMFQYGKLIIPVVD